jgi:hypothetical protein|tara:strand:+ start:737 stop:877 length:141 start_codon:yes stop_codon:yes gene_type:complete
MILFFVFGFICGITFEQELDTIPKIKPIVFKLLEKIKQASTKNEKQ